MKGSGIIVGLIIVITICIIIGVVVTRKNVVKGSNKKVRFFLDTDKYMIGGWCQCYGDTSKWGANVNVLCPGGFQPGSSGKPPIGPINPVDTTQYINGVYLTLGGNGVEGDCLNVNTAISNAKKINATGFCFDMEGCLNNNLDGVINFINTVTKLTGSSYKYMYTPQGDGNPTITEHQISKFDYIAPMFYWGNDTYDKVTINMIKGWINNWITAGVPPNKLILTFQSASAANNHQDILKCLVKEMTDNGYAGLLGWPNQSVPQNNVDNINVINNCVNNGCTCPSTPPSTSSKPPSPGTCGTWNDICPKCPGDSSTCIPCTTDPSKWQCP